MAALRYFICVGVFAIFSTLASCKASPTEVPDGDLEECERAVADPRNDMLRCFSLDLTPVEFEERVQSFNGSRCTKCHVYCSNQDQFIGCLRERADNLTLISNRATRMAAFQRELLEEGVKFFCNNDAEMFTEIMDADNRMCLTENVEGCLSDIDNLRIPRSRLCDAQTTGGDTITDEFICRLLVQYLECAEKETTACSPEVKTVITAGISAIKQLGPCAKYY